MTAANTIPQATKADVSDKLLQLQGTVSIVENIQRRADHLLEALVLDLIDGSTTGDTLTDFVLVSNDLYDLTVMAAYIELGTMIAASPQQEILVVQKAEYWDGEDLILIRNIHLAVLRDDSLRFGVNTLSFSIPVEPGYLFYREVLKDDRMIGGYARKDTEWLSVGPIHDQYTVPTAPRKEHGGYLIVPEDARCYIEFLPTDNEAGLWLDYGISSSQLTDLHRTWIRYKSKS